MKLKGIDGGPHKRWSMWFNSMIREEPYLGSNGTGRSGESRCFFRDWYQGAAWLSSARAVRCWVKSRNERNPYFQLPAHNGGDSGKTASARSEEGGDDVKSSWPLCPGLHTCYNGRYRGSRSREVEPISQSLSQFGLKSATRLHEGGIASNRASAMAR